VFFALLPAIMISFLAEPIVKLIFSERYINSVIILKILPFGYFFVVIFEILSHILIACNKQWYATKVALLMAVVNVPVMVAAGNNYGGRGIAWTFLITFSFFSVLLLIRVVLLNIGFSFSSKNGHNSSLSQ
jgi:O-antigen/teichoic acid export membrane protein